MVKKRTAKARKTRTKKGRTGLFPTVRERVLSVLMLNPGERWHLRSLVRRVGMAQGSVQREVERLAGAEVLLREQDGNRVYYRINEACPFYPELRGLILKTCGLVDVLKRALEPLAKTIEVAFVYGSVAKGDERAASDIDVMVVGAAEFGEVVQALSPTQEELSREVNPSVYDAEEVRRRLAEDDPFIREVWESPKLYLIGDEDELRRLAKR